MANFTRIVSVFIVASFSGCQSDGSFQQQHTSATRTACTSVIDASGLLCSRCGDDAEPECLPAQCGVIDRCLHCVDPEGREARDCSIDYEVLRTGSFSTAPGGDYSLASCHFMWGAPAVSGTTCHYPGTSSCVVSETDGWHCLSCTYADGSGSEICSDASEPLPDPLTGRPDDLPAPGTCVSESADGVVVCATCTRDDLSATRSCHYPGVQSCGHGGDDDCLARCTLVDGAEVRLCNSERGPVLVR